MSEQSEGFPGTAWHRRIPRSLTEAWDGARTLLSLTLKVCSLAEFALHMSHHHGNSEVAEKRKDPPVGPLNTAADGEEVSRSYALMQRGIVGQYASAINELRTAIRQKEPSLEQVADEFAASAEGIAEWSLYSSDFPLAIRVPLVAASIHELVFYLAKSFCKNVQLAVCFAKINVLETDPDREDMNEEIDKDIDDIMNDPLAFLEGSLAPDDIVQHWETAAKQVRRLSLPSPGERRILEVRLQQELCRAADRRLITKRAYPSDEKPLTQDEVRGLHRKHPDRQFIPTPLQVSILEALDGKALKKEPLGNACKVDPSRFYRRGGLKELMDEGIVDWKSGIGFYRPDAAPPEALEL